VRIAFLHPYKMADHFFVEAVEVAAIADLRRAGHDAEAVDYLFEERRPEAEQLRELRAGLEGYDLVFLERAWSDELVRALGGLRVVGWARDDLVTRGLLEAAVVEPSRAVARSVVEAVAAQQRLDQVPGLVVRSGDAVVRTRTTNRRLALLEELGDASFDHRARRSLSRGAANPDRAVVVANLGCAYRNVPDRSGVFDGVPMPPEVSTAGCTFCEVEAYERMTEDEAIGLLVRQIEAVLRDRPGVRQIAVKDDYAVRFLGKLGDALRALPLGDREVLLSARADYLLQLRPEIEAALAGRFPTPLGFYLIGFENFSDAELVRFHKGSSAAQLERVVLLMQDWAARFPRRFRVTPTGGFILFTPWTTLADLRINADAMRRLGFERFRGKALLSQLRLRPTLPLYWLAKRDGLLLEAFARPEDSDARRRGYDVDQPWRFADPKVAEVHRAVLDAAGLDDAALFEVFEEALDAAAGVARGKRGRPTRLLVAPNDRPTRKGPSTQQISLGRGCNQACTFCLARGEERTPPRARAARAVAAVRAAAQEGVETVVLTGAEPTLEWYLRDLVRLARDLGVRQVVLETNATAFEAHGGVAALGIDRARVALHGLDSARSDALTRDPGGHARTLAGLDALAAAGIATEVAFALVPETRGALAELLQRARARWPRLERVVARYVPTGPPGFAPLDLAEAAHELEAAVAASEESGLPIEAAVDGELPPCVFADPGRVKAILRTGPALVARDSGQHRRIAACEACVLRSVCPGPLTPLATRVAATVRPLTERDPIEGLVPLSRERARVLSEYRSSFFVDSGEKVLERRIVRINFHCNQACDFCFVSRELPAIDHEIVEREIRDVAARGATLELSGGEPTLNPRVVEYLRFAREVGVRDLELQTNAIKMADPAFAAELVAAGLTRAFVSLHGTTAAVCDRVTAAPGTFVRTVAGIQNLLAGGVAVRINFVLCGYNVAELPTLPAFIRDVLCAGLPDAKVDANFSFVAASTDNVPRDTKLIPRFSDVAWALEAAHTAALERGLVWTGFESKCGVPACYLPLGLREAHFAHDLPDEERARATGFTKAPACATCELDRRCYGIRTTYAEMYGVDELRPIRGGEVTAAAGQRSWADAVGGSPDREQVQLRAGLRQLMKKERPSREEAERTAAVAREAGLAAEVFVEGPRTIAFVARTPEVVAEAMALEPASVASFHDRRPLVLRMGALLGYPACCVEAFADSAEQSDRALVRRLAEAQGDQTFGPERNWVAAHLRAFSHFPCSPDCEATAELGRRTLAAIAVERPTYAAALDRALRSAAVLAEDGQFALLEGAVRDGDGFAYERVLSHDNLGLDPGARASAAFGQFRASVVQLLTRGDRIVRADDALRVERGGVRVGEIPRPRGAPWLLDFTGGARAPRRLPVFEEVGELKLQIDSPCGQACEFCSIPLARVPKPDAPALLRALEEGAARGQRALRLTGVDPLAFPSIVPLLAAARERGFSAVELHGPTTRLDAALLDEILAVAPPRLRFHVPLYGAEAAIHDAVVGRTGAFALVIGALDALAARAVPVTLHTVLTPRVLAALPAIVALAQQRALPFAADLPFPDTESEDDAFHRVALPQRTIADALVGSGLDVRALAGVAGLAPCVLHAALRAVDPVRAAALVELRRGPAPATGVRTPTVKCRHADRCGWLGLCSGQLLRSYVGVFGDEELVAL